MTSNEILDLVTDRLADEEVYNDAKRVVQQARLPPVTHRGSFRRAQVQVTTASDFEDSDGAADDELWMARVAPVEGQQRGSEQAKDLAEH